MKRFIAAGLITAALVIPPATSAFATVNPSTGQPSQTCLSSSSTQLEPGNAASAPGSAFNETSPGTAGTVYAGNGVSANTANSTAAVSQYDVACLQYTKSH